MDIKTFLILGGYGNVGRVLTRLLLQETNVRLVLAGRNFEKAKAAADQFNNLFEGNRVFILLINTVLLLSWLALTWVVERKKIAYLRSGNNSH